MYLLAASGTYLNDMIHHLLTEIDRMIFVTRYNIVIINNNISRLLIISFSISAKIKCNSAFLFNFITNVTVITHILNKRIDIQC